MSFYEKVPRKFEAYAWIGPTTKPQFPKRFDPEIIRSPYGGEGYVLVEDDGQLKSIVPGDYVLKLQEDEYIRVSKATFEANYRAV